MSELISVKPSGFFQNIFEFFKRDSAKKRKVLLKEIYSENMSEMMLYMFDWKCEKLTKLDINRLENLLICEGMAAVWMYEDKPIVTNAFFTGDLSPYDGLLEDVTCITLDGKSVTFRDWKNSPDVAIIFNNPYMSRDINVGRFAEMFAETDVSIRAQVINTRLAPVITSTNASNKKALESALSRIRDGVPQVVKLDPVSNLLSDDATEYKMDYLTQPEAVDKIQYLSRFHEDLRRRMLNLYGLATVGSEKMAQQSVSEINNGSKASLVLPMSRLRARQGDDTNGAEKISKVLGVPCTVRLSDLIQSEYKESMIMEDTADAPVDASEVSDSDGKENLE